jgi:hypothetical protein
MFSIFDPFLYSAGVYRHLFFFHSRSSNRSKRSVWFDIGLDIESGVELEEI